MTDTALKPCPSCKSSSLYYFESTAPYYSKSSDNPTRIVCRDCGASAPKEAWSKRIEDERVKEIETVGLAFVMLIFIILFFGQPSLHDAIIHYLMGGNQNG